MSKADEPRYEQVDLGVCRPSETNPRQTFEPKAMAELVASIREHGIIEPIVLHRIEGKAPGDTTFEIVAGERRWRAAREAKLKKVPAIVRELSDLQVLEIQLIENLQRAGGVGAEVSWFFASATCASSRPRCARASSQR